MRRAFYRRVVVKPVDPVEPTYDFNREDFVKLKTRKAKNKYLKIARFREERANLIGLDLSGLDLRGLDFYRANFRYVDFRGAKLTGAKFYGADFSYAKFYYADLNHMDLTVVDLRGANLYGVKDGKWKKNKEKIIQLIQEFNLNKGD